MIVAGIDPELQMGNIKLSPAKNANLKDLLPEIQKATNKQQQKKCEAS